jgi:hypothetical protein
VIAEFISFDPLPQYSFLQGLSDRPRKQNLQDSFTTLGTIGHIRRTEKSGCIDHLLLRFLPIVPIVVKKHLEQ